MTRRTLATATGTAPVQTRAPGRGRLKGGSATGAGVVEAQLPPTLAEAFPQRPADVDISRAKDTTSGQVVSCEGCGTIYGIGDSPFCKDGHAPWWQRKNEFVPYWDDGIGKMIHDHGERTREMKRAKLDYRGRARGEPNGWEY